MQDPPTQPPLGPFAHTEYFFTTGLRAGEVASVRSGTGEVLLTYRSFAGVVGVVAALLSGIVAVAGIASVLFLLAEAAPLRAASVLVLTLVFTAFITLLAPRTNVTLYDNGQPALIITQRSMFPTTTYALSTPNGAQLADVRKSPFSRMARNRWKILYNGRYLGEAAERSFAGALIRKVYGKFSRRFETNVVITHGGIEAGRILRRPDPAGRVDVLEVVSDALDRRVLVGVATLILGGEP